MHPTQHFSELGVDRRFGNCHIKAFHEPLRARVGKHYLVAGTALVDRLRFILSFRTPDEVFGEFAELMAGFDFLHGA